MAAGQPVDALRDDPSVAVLIGRHQRSDVAISYFARPVSDVQGWDDVFVDRFGQARDVRRRDH